jgi:iron complex outermembrane recepter protein
MQQIRLQFRKKRITQLRFATVCTIGAHFAHAQTSGDLGSVQSNAAAAGTGCAPVNQARLSIRHPRRPL